MPCGDVQVPNSNAGLISGGVFGDEWPSPIQCWNGFEISGDATPRCELHEDDTTPTWTIPECLPQQCSNPSGTFGDTIPVECEDGHAPVLDGIPWTLGGDSCHWPVEILQKHFFQIERTALRTATARVLIPAESAPHAMSRRQDARWARALLLREGGQGGEGGEGGGQGGAFDLVVHERGQPVDAQLGALAAVFGAAAEHGAALAPGALYLIRDTESSYWAEEARRNPPSDSRPP